MADSTVEQKTSKRDALRKIELQYQKQWSDNKVYEKELPPCSSENEADWKTLHDTHPKYMATFPYPYMNGRLHLGHSFSFSKAEFSVRWEQLKGKNALFPFGLHVTGMPIKASADKIAREIELFGSDFSKFYENQNNLNSSLEALDLNNKNQTTQPKNPYQFEIMRSIGFSLDEIHKFADPSYWIKTFPPLAIQDVSGMGCCVDWRRSFVTTDYNLYYDSFARWQFQRLRDMGKIQYGKRYTIWSVKDGQPCMDHDRQSGEGLGPTEYTAIKLKVLSWGENMSSVSSSLTSLDLSKHKVYLVAATLRPETMYGQTNCYVGVKIKYGVFDVGNGEIYIMTERAAKNYSYQGDFESPDKVVNLGHIAGNDLVGTVVNPPLSKYESVYVLPMENVSANKGTGIVTSVPSDSPVDFMTLQDLKRKPDYYHIQSSWVENYDPLPIIKSQAYGDLTAQYLCEHLKINSQKDTLQLDQAKDLAYKEGFYNGTMLVGKYAGKPVQEAKPLVREDLIASGDAFAYAEPEGLIMSRSGDECIVALRPQWYIDYGEPEWLALTKSYLDKMSTGSVETRHQFNKTLDWLKQWACARTYGLGSKVPFSDDEILIESLSDSTIYMAYYTVSHLLHPTSLNHTEPGPLNILPEDMDYAAWDYVFQGKPLPEGHSKPEELKQLRKSFLYWYPMDLRTSGKDLIQNHLTFCLYNHSAMFPEELQPRAIHGNGHLLLNGNKMSKSTGNFMTLADSLIMYGADATRIALADAGDGLEDANFETTTANASILRLYTTLEWIMGVYQVESGLDFAKLDPVACRDANSPHNLFDKVFLAMIDKATIDTIDAYESSQFRAALKSGFYEMLAARDWYRDAVTVSGINMHKGVIDKFVERLCTLMLPITPHWSEHIWTHVLKKDSSIINHKIDLNEFKSQECISFMQKYSSIGEYIKKLVKSIRDAELLVLKQAKAKKLKTVVAFDPKLPKAITITTCSVYPKWQGQVVQVLKPCYISESNTFDDQKIKAELGKSGLLKDKKTMPFANEIKKSVLKDGPSSFDRTLLFDEVETIQNLVPYISSALNFAKVEISSTDDETLAKNATPGSPSFVITNI
ncbi:hypothetical protein BB560_002087 [Smittium megazygosporum]|uniref:leucine--tRNA ligase n=1 Tax=Smittium megazygosporum TaxID=133381 RepID=A0A2T9ZFQ4_9FUNG|nr:hypothetical protein BB560_002087 [Smittium megazygosporum]